MARNRDRHDDDEVDDDDEDYDPRPRKRKKRSSGGSGPLDSTFADTNIVILILFAVCCRGIALILSLICFFTAQDPKAKSNAMLVMIIDGGLVVLLIILKMMGLLAFGAGAAGR